MNLQNSQDNQDRSRVESNPATWAHNLPKETSFNTETLERQEKLCILTNSKYILPKLDYIILKWNQNRLVYQTSLIQNQKIESRILKVLSNFESINLKNFQWNQNFKKLGLDSLNQTALLVSIEHEFTVLFPDGVFEGFDNLEQVISFIQKNINAI